MHRIVIVGGGFAGLNAAQGLGRDARVEVTLLFVVLRWAWAYWTFRRGARLIVGKDWRFYADAPSDEHSRET